MSHNTQRDVKESVEYSTDDYLIRLAMDGIWLDTDDNGNIRIRDTIHAQWANEEEEHIIYSNLLGCCGTPPLRVPTRLAEGVETYR